MTFATPRHDTVVAVLKAILDKFNVKYSHDYRDRNSEKYHAVDGKSIKFWNNFPTSGDGLDAALYNCNSYLSQYGLMLVQHIWARKENEEIIATLRGCNTMVTANVDKYTFSLLVKPVPKALGSIEVPEIAEVVDSSKPIKVNDPIRVLNPATQQMVDCYWESHSPDSWFITTKNSRPKEYAKLANGNSKYKDYIQHVRGYAGQATMTQKEMIALLNSGQYTIG